ncbi:MAG: hypothetical protein M3068_14750 [Gemmatimonadota bacterium]|nr:hypothetical protein [Gemmatimonadota bacterium]
MVRLAVVLCSLCNVAAGLLLAALILVAGRDGPVLIPLLVGLSVAVQGAYSLFYFVALRAPRDALTELLVLGEVAALLVGAAGAVGSFAVNVHALITHGDVEGLPTIMASLMAAQAMLVLGYLWLRRGRTAMA